MWRALFSAIGIVLLILGLECLAIDQAILADGSARDPMQQARVQTASLFGNSGQLGQMEKGRIFRPAEWIPWSLLASGAVTVIYAASYRRG